MEAQQAQGERYRFTIRVGILAVFFSIVFIISSIILGIISWRFYSNSVFLTHQVTRALSVSAVKEVTNRLAPARLTSELTGKIISTNAIDPNSVAQLVNYTQQLLIAVPEAKMAYFGDEQGNFTISRRESNGTISSEVIDLRTKPKRYYLHRDKMGQVIRRDNKTDFDYDPRQRPWYRAAKKNNEAIWSSPYEFYSGGEGKTLGITRAAPVVIDQQLVGVVGVDITLSAIAEFLAQFKVTKNGVSYIVDQKGRLIAFPGRNDGLQNISESSQDWATYAYQAYKKKPASYFNFTFKGEDYQSTVFKIAGFLQHEWLIFIVIPYDDIVGPVLYANFLTLILCTSLIILSLALVSILSGHITRPINELTKDLEKVRNFQLGTDEVIHSRIKEVHNMSSVIQSMKIGLKSFQQYIPEMLVRKLIVSGEAAKIGGHSRNITTLFTDIESFTTVSEKISDEEVMTQMCEYFDILSHIVVENKGTVDKYIGDSLMAFWGAPDDDDEQVLHACRSVLLAQEALRQQNFLWEQQGKQTFHTRFGLNAGNAIVGNLGSRNRLNYTAIGDQVNLASRLEQINKVYGTYIIVSDSVYEVAKEDFLFRVLDKISVKGQTQEHYIYELIGFKSPEHIERYSDYCSRFEKAMLSYQSKKFPEALALYQAILEDYPKDKTAQLFAERCEYYLQHPVSKDWDGVWVYTKK